jgi:hypothetical protein
VHLAVLPGGLADRVGVQGSGKEAEVGKGILRSRREALSAPPEQLLLGGQQRMTSLYQTCVRKELVEALTAKKKLVRLWFYVDIRTALTGGERDDAIVAAPEDRRLTICSSATACPAADSDRDPEERCPNRGSPPLDCGARHSPGRLRASGPPNHPRGEPHVACSSQHNSFHRVVGGPLALAALEC